jgi:hypothetical protein
MDSLRRETTAIIDEADAMHEDWLVNRNSRQSANTEVNRARVGPKGGKGAGWEQQSLDLFGATVLHRRRPFEDAAILGRSIVVRTKYRSGGVEPFKAEEFQPYAAELKTLAETVEWERVSERGGDRIADTWAPLQEVGACLGAEWEPFAKGQMEQARTNLKLGHQEEPSQAVFLALLALALDGDLSENQQPKERVLLSAVAQSLQDGAGLNSWQAGQILRDLGFDTRTAGGSRYVYTGGTAKLGEVGQALGIQDDWIEQQAAYCNGPPGGMKP